MKKFYVLLVLIILNSCSNNDRKQDFHEVETYFKMQEENQQPQISPSVEDVKVVAFLPLSGKDRGLGNNVANALVMAENERTTQNIEIKIIDSNKNYSKSEWESQLQGVRAILGPVFSERTIQIYNEIRDYNLPIFTLSNDHALLDNHNLFVMGDMYEDTFIPVLKYINQNEVHEIVALFPNNELGRFLDEYLQSLVEDHSLPPTKIILYNTLDDYAYQAVAIKQSLHQRISEEEINDVLDDIFEDNEGDEAVIDEKSNNYQHRVLVISVESAENFAMFLRQFDLVAEEQDVLPTFINLKSCGGMKSYIAQGLTTVCVAAKFNLLEDFESRYKNLFNESPSRVAEIAYDTLNFIGDYHDKFPLRAFDTLVYKGVNGRFYLEDTGKNTRQYILK